MVVLDRKDLNHSLVGRRGGGGDGEASEGNFLEDLRKSLPSPTVITKPLSNRELTTCQSLC